MGRSLARCLFQKGGEFHPTKQKRRRARGSTRRLYQKIWYARVLMFCSICEISRCSIHFCRGILTPPLLTSHLIGVTAAACSGLDMLVHSTLHTAYGMIHTT